MTAKKPKGYSPLEGLDLILEEEWNLYYDAESIQEKLAVLSFSRDIYFKLMELYPKHRLHYHRKYEEDEEEEEQEI